MRGREYSQRGEEVQDWALNLSFVAGFHWSSQMAGVCPVLLQPQPQVFLPRSSQLMQPMPPLASANDFLSLPRMIWSPKDEEGK